VAAASTGALFGSAMQSTPVLLLVSAIFFLMGASMLGAFDIALPSGMQTRLQSGPRTGVIGAVLMGMVTGLVASPCVGPVLVVLLTFVANVGNLLYGFSLLFVFALGLGMLFIVIGTFAGALNALPAAGEWMETVKHVFGVILIGVGIYYVRRLLGPDLSLMAVGLFVLLIGTFFGAFRAVPDPAPHSLLLRKGLGIALVLCGGFILLVGTAGVTGVSLRPASPGSVESVAPAGEEAAPNWVTDDEAGLEMARREGKPVLIDFYADWCAACRELDRETWVDDQVRAETKRFVAIKMDFTKESDWSKAKKVDYDILGLPTVIFLDSKGNEVERFFGFRPPGQVLASLQKIR
jgi:thiol:disulfide interchange protein DsbD